MDIFEKARFSQAILTNQGWVALVKELRTRYSTALASCNFEDTSRMQLYVAKLQMLKEIEDLLKEPIEKVKKEQEKEN